MLNGILAVDKPTGMTSAAVVRTVRYLLPRRTPVGHAGTLDPLAQGVLPLLCGTATRLLDMLHEFPKTYTVTAEFGYETDTLDRDGTVVAHTQSLPTPATVNTACATLVGNVVQTPPRYAAIKLHGKPLYRYARQGLALPVPLQDLAREVRIYACVLLHMRGRHAVLRVTCARGTYVRSLVRDLAHHLGTLATVVALVREESAGWQRRACIALHELNTTNLHVHLRPLTHLPWPQLRLADATSCAKLQQGQTLPCPTTLFTQPHKKFLLAHRTGKVFGIGTQPQNNVLHMCRAL